MYLKKKRDFPPQAAMMQLSKVITASEQLDREKVSLAALYKTSKLASLCLKKQTEEGLQSLHFCHLGHSFQCGSMQAKTILTYRPWPVLPSLPTH